VALVVLAGAGGVGLYAAPAAWGASRQSQNVALIPSDSDPNAGTLQTSGTVDGADADSFDGFDFSFLDEGSIDSQTLAQYDTVVLNEVNTSDLSDAQEQALAGFVTGGGKLIIHDADATVGNDYSWLPVPAAAGQSCQNCGNTDGTASVVENTSLVSDDPSSPSYVDLSELPDNTDAVGDANVLLTNDPRWNWTMEATNSQNVHGAVGAYASDGGLVIYNGYDTDSADTPEPSGTNWLQKMWYQELAQQWNPDGLPHDTPAGSGGGPQVHCGRESVAIGVVQVCADQISGSGADMAASGNVVLDAGVSVGDGPIAIDQDANQISTDGSVPITLLRRGGNLSLGRASLTIDATATTDPVSGTTGLAKVTLEDVDLGTLGSLRVGGLPFSMPLPAGVTMYLDNELDGGLVGAASLQLPLLGDVHPSGALSLGFFASSPNPVVALGGAAHLGSIDFGKGWQFSGLDLTYREPTDTWTASGGLEVPLGSLQASGARVHGQLDALNVLIGGQNVPLGDSGFFFSQFGGGVSGLVRGPLRISAETGGYWGVPKLPVEPFYLNDVTFTLDFGGSASLHGAVAFLLKDHSPVQGTIDLKLGLKPFAASGKVAVDASLPTISLKADESAAFTAKHFTLQGKGKLSIQLLRGTGDAVASDKGLGASGRLCPVGLSWACASMGFAGTWKRLEQLAKGDLGALDIIGGDPQSLVTVAAARRRTQLVRVAPGRTFLFLDVTGAHGPPKLELRAPDGALYRTSRPRPSLLVGMQPRYRLTAVTIVRPQAGTWRVTVLGSPGVLRLQSRTLHPVRLIGATLHAPASSARHPLRGTRTRLAIRWTSSGLPRDVRVSVVDRTAHGGRRVLASGKPPAGHLTLRLGALATGSNALALVATARGVPFQQVALHAVVWRAAKKPARKRKR